MVSNPAPVIHLVHKDVSNLLNSKILGTCFPRLPRQHKEQYSKNGLLTAARKGEWL